VTNPPQSTRGTASVTVRSPRSRRWLRIASAVVAVAAAVAVFDGGLWLLRGSGSRSTARGESIGSRIPALSGTDLAGRRIVLSHLERRPLIVTFFGSWCGPCRREANVFPVVARKFGGRVSILAVAVSDTASHDRRFARRYGWSWPVVEDTGFGWSVAFGLPGVPGTYVLDSRGRVADRLFGPVTETALTADLGKLVSGD
jgi:cytochrome c biogenesis protein CcmG/thiol:disulfide interchange protein DsbE